MDAKEGRVCYVYICVHGLGSAELAKMLHGNKERCPFSDAPSHTLLACRRKIQWRREEALEKKATNKWRCGVSENKNGRSNEGPVR